MFIERALLLANISLPVMANFHIPFPLTLYSEDLRLISLSRVLSQMRQATRETETAEHD